MDTRREAVTGAAGCLAAALGAVVGLAVWTPYGRAGLFGGFEGAVNWTVLWLGLPVMTLGGIAVALGIFAVARGRWRPALGLAGAVAALTALGFGLDVLAPPPLPDCYDPC
ncbi:hypothetical protein [Streptomyces sp. BE147]|uniref:hypothetical protein n=1 Tax=unclassified Streptomyces TaxID=2593676 RepID=UPI002E792801|nr:hypothetical protein [Streptomyces sp. BE147]MEE1737921.1 hypothetical protein [Streptomyces sp. BE147]